MEGQVEHIILTRFNLAIKFGCDRRRNSTVPTEKPWLDKDYLKYRFDIFERYTYQSMLNQSDKNFKWIVMFHIDTPEEFKEKIIRFEKNMPQFTPMFFDNNQSERMGEIIMHYIHDNYSGKKVITSRIDNDDSVHTTFVENIKKDIELNSILTYRNGLQYDIRNGLVLKCPYVNNHFLSLCANSEDKNNHIMLYDHSMIIEAAPNFNFSVIDKECELPLWIEVITENNYSNAPRWRFSSVLIPYGYKEEYPILDFNWNNHCQWICEMIKNYVLVFINILRRDICTLIGRGKGFLDSIRRLEHSADKR
jgi:hypothetical protein